MAKFLPLVRSVLGWPPKQTLLLGRPVPTNLQTLEPIAVVHDRRLSAGIFAQKAKAKSASKVYRLALWKSYQDPRGRWLVSTSFFPDEIDPALRLLEECRRRMTAAPIERA